MAEGITALTQVHRKVVYKPKNTLGNKKGMNIYNVTDKDTGEYLMTGTGADIEDAYGYSSQNMANYERKGYAMGGKYLLEKVTPSK